MTRLTHRLFSMISPVLISAFNIFCSRQWLAYNIKKHFSDQIIFRQLAKATDSLLVVGNDAHLNDITTTNNLDLSAAGLMSDIDSSADEITVPHTLKKSESSQYQLNQAALLLWAAIGDTADNEIVWPPTAKDLSIEECLKFVPVLLFNFVSLMTGHVDIVKDWTEYADFDKGIQRKILSIA